MQTILNWSLLAVAGSASLSPLQAETYTATVAVSDWNNASLWNAPQMAGNDFVFDPTASWQTITATTESFDGNSLTLKGGRLYVQATMEQDLIFTEEGSLHCNTNNGVYSGTWTIIDTGTFLVRRPSANIDAHLIGDGEFYIGDDNVLKNLAKIAADSLNEFTGTLVAGILGGGDVCILEFKGDVNAPEATIKLDSWDNGGVVEYSQLKLNRAIAVSAVILGGEALEPGVYSFNDLTAQQKLYFIDGGGQLIVSPPDAPTGTLIEVSDLSPDLEESSS